MVFSGFVTTGADVGGKSKSWLAPTATASLLYSKNGGWNEIGLGMAADPAGDHEIFANSFVQIDLSGLLAQAQIDSFQLMIDKVQCGDGFSIWGSNTADQPGTLLMTGTSALDDKAVNVTNYGGYRYISVSATSGNILLDAVSVTGDRVNCATPEPGTLALGLAACIGLFSKKLIQRFA